jgi:hypothetical protein
LRYALHPSHPQAIVFTGSPGELALMLEDIGTDNDPDESGIEMIEYGGLLISPAVNRNAKHDGNPGFGFDLLDAHGSRSVGRLILMDTDDQLENAPEWVVWYDSEETAAETLEILGARASRPKISSVTLDLCHEEESVEESAALIAAAHGVSVTVVDPQGPGGGWPVVRLSGLTPNVEKALRDDERGWGLEDDEIRDWLDA